MRKPRHPCGWFSHMESITQWSNEMRPRRCRKSCGEPPSRHIHRKIRIGHLVSMVALRPPPRLLEWRRRSYRGSHTVEQRTVCPECDPSESAKERCGIQRSVGEFPQQALAENAESRAAVKDIKLAVDSNFDARRITAVAQVFELRSGSRSSYAQNLTSMAFLSGFPPHADAAPGGEYPKQ